MRAVLLSLVVQGAVAAKFCFNDEFTSGLCPDNAVAICEASSGKTCIKAGLEYDVSGVNGCDKFEAGSVTGACLTIDNEDTDPTAFPYCNPHARTYCECKPCETNDDCNGVTYNHPTTCQDNAAGVQDAYAAAFAAGQNSISCVDDCANALRKTYEDLGGC